MVNKTEKNSSSSSFRKIPATIPMRQRVSQDVLAFQQYNVRADNISMAFLM